MSIFSSAIFLATPGGSFDPVVFIWVLEAFRFGIIVAVEQQSMKSLTTLIGKRRG